jgi:hypothetical protein
MSTDVDPHSFTVILQTQRADGARATCHGFPQLAAVQPTRVLVVGDRGTAAWRHDLVDSLRSELGAATTVAAHSCSGPGAFGCWATHEPGVRNLLVVVAGARVPSPDLEGLVDGWRARGFETVGVFRADLDPDVVLPTAMRTQHAPNWQSDIREVAAEITDSVLLGAEERRVFVSYARADGAATAERVAGILTRLRFDVFLDRFQLVPGSDFVERIADELVDKAMIVVVETPHAVRSPWVRYEVSTAVTRRLGLTAIHLGADGPTIGEIDEVARCRVNHDDAIADFVLRQHRTQLRERREALLDSVWRSLCSAGLRRNQIAPVPAGFHIDSKGRKYSVAVHPRPADLHHFRLAHERADPTMDAVVVHPQPVRIDRRRDLAWLTGHTGVVAVDEGLIDAAARQIAGGTL